MSYFCSECQREHKEGTQIYTRHKKYAEGSGPVVESGGESRDRRPKGSKAEEAFLEANWRRSMGMEK